MAEQSASHEIRTILVDDEPLARDNLKALLARDPDIRIVAQCGSGVAALSEIRACKPDLVFLDVQMPECDGFDVLEQLGGSLPAALVFVTAYDQYALRAFDAGAIDYLLKPFDSARFAQALARAKERLLLVRNATTPVSPKRWAIKSSGELLFVDLSEIDWIEAADYYVCIHANGRNHLMRRSMVDVASELQQAAFCRIHRGAIVNLDRIRRLETAHDGGTVVVLKDGQQLPLSRRYRKELEARLGLGGR